MAKSNIIPNSGEIIHFEYDRDYVDFALIELDRFDQPMTRTLSSFLRRRYGDDYWFCIDICGDDRIDAYLLAGKEIRQDELVLHIYTIAVRRHFEGKGWGKKLMLHLLNKAKTDPEGISAVTLEVRDNNNRAHQFYLHLGFVETGIVPDYYDSGVNAILMRLDL